MPQYEVNVTVNDTTESFVIDAKDRRVAVRQAANLFWKQYRGLFGTVHDCVTVSDPFREVHYHRHFNCSDRVNKLLPEDVIRRVIEESAGKLERCLHDNRGRKKVTSLCRVKRRRYHDSGIRIAPGISVVTDRRTGAETFYYHMLVKPQRSRGGVVIQRRKYKAIRLEASNLSDAVDEVRQNKLHEKHKRKARKMKVRDIRFLKHVSGDLCLSGKERQKYEPVLPFYEQPRNNDHSKNGSPKPPPC